jgi:hypothetical protein
VGRTDLGLLLLLVLGRDRADATLPKLSCVLTE